MKYMIYAAILLVFSLPLIRLPVREWTRSRPAAVPPLASRNEREQVGEDARKAIQAVELLQSALAEIGEESPAALSGPVTDDPATPKRSLSDYRRIMRLRALIAEFLTARKETSDRRRIEKLTDLRRKIERAGRKPEEDKLYDLLIKMLPSPRGSDSSQ